MSSPVILKTVFKSQGSRVSRILSLVPSFVKRGNKVSQHHVDFIQQLMSRYPNDPKEISGTGDYENSILVLYD